ncbi:MAG: hypothetical protein CYPHOPRED_002293 [Cyphobasidiales sp. Tagirdzhanova-0007]|nr:MAG: hypothetical protein CYPHOPRED_002293 [Cyphobasidiales sp. Tagirdzhanova-0007]
MLGFSFVLIALPALVVAQSSVNGSNAAEASASANCSSADRSAAIAYGARLCNTVGVTINTTATPTGGNSSTNAVGVSNGAGSTTFNSSTAPTPAVNSSSASNTSSSVPSPPPGSSTSSATSSSSSSTQPSKSAASKLARTGNELLGVVGAAASVAILAALAL